MLVRNVDDGDILRECARKPNSMSICQSEHRYLPDLEDLPESQGGEGRHKCAGCAYEKGYDDAFENRAKSFDPNSLNDSQAGTGRHKDVEAAYDLGYRTGSKRLRRDQP